MQIQRARRPDFTAAWFWAALIYVFPHGTVYVLHMHMQISRSRTWEAEGSSHEVDGKVYQQPNRKLWRKSDLVALDGDAALGLREGETGLKGPSFFFLVHDANKLKRF